MIKKRGTVNNGASISSPLITNSFLVSALRLLADSCEEGDTVLLPVGVVDAISGDEIDAPRFKSISCRTAIKYIANMIEE